MLHLACKPLSLAHNKAGFYQYFNTFHYHVAIWSSFLGLNVPEITITEKEQGCFGFYQHHTCSKFGTIVKQHLKKSLASCPLASCPRFTNNRIQTTTPSDLYAQLCHLIVGLKHVGIHHSLGLLDTWLQSKPNNHTLV